jgi:hypothetical protein
MKCTTKPSLARLPHHHHSRPKRNFPPHHSRPLGADPVRDSPRIGASLFIVGAVTQDVACRKIADQMEE